MAAVVGISTGIAGVLVGAAVHWSGYIVGAVLVTFCGIAICILYDLYDTVALCLAMLELSSLPKAELRQKLKEYRERSSNDALQDDEATDKVLSEVYDRMGDLILSKFEMALQWGPLIFLGVGILCCVICGSIDGTPGILLALSVAVTVLAGLMSCVCITLFCCFVKPLVENVVKASLDAYVDHLRANLEKD